MNIDAHHMSYWKLARIAPAPVTLVSPTSHEVYRLVLDLLDADSGKGLPHGLSVRGTMGNKRSRFDADVRNNISKD
ncbi:MAG: hypothetical protein Q7L07_08700 [Pseudohongiella sp.]|nr:hypothetical protein [Pseudohongiella sp.]